MAVKHQRITQRQIAELAGVSQATVSLVLNGKAEDAATRIPDETRKRVLDVIRQTTYIADPAARRLAGVGNKILGVFTYEPAFPTGSQDFYTPLLAGIESQAEALGCDLLMFTSAPVNDGRRQIFHENNRLGLADGCLLLGLEMDGAELSRLVESGFPFVAIGRRDAAQVSYVGADYVEGTATLVREAMALGHNRFFYLHVDSTGESVLDRQRGFLRELESSTAMHKTRASDATDLASDWVAIRDYDPTVLFVEDPSSARVLHDLAVAAGVSVPGDLSIVVLGEPSRQNGLDIDFTRLSPPRTELGAQAVALLSRILSSDDEPTDAERQVLLHCAVIPGSTLAHPAIPESTT